MNSLNSRQQNAFNTESRISAADTAGALTYSASSAGVDSISDINSVDQRSVQDVGEISQTSSNRFVDIIDNVEVREPKIESKDHMWRPAPIVGRDFTQKQGEVEIMTKPAPITSQLRDPMKNNFVLPSHFAAYEKQRQDGGDDMSWPG